MPHCVTDHSGLRKSLGVILRTKKSAELRSGSQHREVVRTNGECLDAFGTIATCEIRADGPDGGDFLEHVIAGPKVFEFSDREADIAELQCAIFGDDLNKPFRICVRQWAQ